MRVRNECRSIFPRSTIGEGRKRKMTQTRVTQEIEGERKRERNKARQTLADKTVQEHTRVSKRDRGHEK